MSILHLLGTHKDDAKGDVIFVHGLGGNWWETWATHKSRSESFWPGWLAVQLPDVNVWSLEYSVKPSGWLGTSMPLVDRATNVLTALEAEGLGTRPIIFICHSLGGLLVKQILRSTQTLGVQNWQSLAAQVRGIVFLATPHAGSRLVNYIEALGVILRTTVSVQELTANAPALRDLNLWYRNNAKALGIDTLVLFETQHTRGVRVVDETSVADHLSISKPSSPDALVPRGVLVFIEACLQRSKMPTRNRKLDNTGKITKQISITNGDIRDSQVITALSSLRSRTNLLLQAQVQFACEHWNLCCARMKN